MTETEATVHGGARPGCTHCCNARAGASTSFCHTATAARMSSSVHSEVLPDDICCLSAAGSEARQRRGTRGSGRRAAARSAQEANDESRPSLSLCSRLTGVYTRLMPLSVSWVS